MKKKNIFWFVLTLVIYNISFYSLRYIFQNLNGFEAQIGFAGIYVLIAAMYLIYGMAD